MANNYGEVVPLGMICNEIGYRQGFGGVLTLGVFMEVKSHNKRTEERSIWSTTGIFIALGVLTALMGLLMYGAIQGVSTSASVDRSPSSPMRATR